jgi:hypothetical protein
MNYTKYKVIMEYLSEKRRFQTITGIISKTTRYHSCWKRGTAPPPDQQATKVPGKQNFTS